MIYPDLAIELLPPAELEIDLEKLWKDLCKELLDRERMSRTHGNRRTYDAGCRGPACSRAMRLHVRRRAGSTANEYYSYCDAIISAWLPLAIIQTDEMFKNLVDSI